MFEYEIKLKVNPEAFYKLSETFARSQAHKELFEKDYYFENEKGRCRIRESSEDDQLTNTFNVKQRLEDTQIKSSKEIEIEFGREANTYQFREALRILGFKDIGIVEKFRCQYKKFGMTINMDSVKFLKNEKSRNYDLDYFIEIEKVLEKQDKNVEDEILEIVDFLRIPRDCQIQKSYSDLLMQRVK